jgi:hypothetical protein
MLISAFSLRIKLSACVHDVASHFASGANLKAFGINVSRSAARWFLTKRTGKGVSVNGEDEWD